MIKVNLITDQTLRSRKLSVAPTVSRMGLVFAAVLLLTGTALAAYWFTLSREITGLTVTRDELRAESLRLAELRKKLFEFEKLKQVRESRIEVIEKLKDFQTGPVLLLNHVIHSIPQDAQLWLTGLDQKGEKVQIAGYAVRSDVIPDFMVNLSSNGIFKSVELELIQEDKEAAKFSLVCLTAQKQPPTE